MQSGQEQEKTRVFQAPALYVAFFYGLLVLWTVGASALYLAAVRAGGVWGDWRYGVMIGFFYLYTWFWSLGLVFRISLDADGRSSEKPPADTVHNGEGGPHHRGVEAPGGSVLSG